MNKQEPAVGSVRILQQDDLEMVLSWRNHEQVRQMMFSSEPISLEQHTGWFERASKEADRQLLVFELDGQPTGFANLGRIACGGITDWGFYLAPHAPKGSGRQLGFTILTHAFRALKLHKVCGQVLDFNQRSIQFHLNQGFQQEGIFRQQHFDGRQYHDIRCFGLLAADWLANN